MVVFTSGCLYYPPLEMETNQAPIIKASNPGEGKVLRLANPMKAFVIVEDDDPVERLDYLWWTEPAGDILPSLPFSNSADEAQQDSGGVTQAGSSVDLIPEERYLDQFLHCRVTDAQGGEDSIEWEIELLLEGS